MIYNNVAFIWYMKCEQGLPKCDSLVLFGRSKHRYSNSADAGVGGWFDCSELPHILPYNRHAVCGQWNFQLSSKFISSRVLSIAGTKYLRILTADQLHAVKVFGQSHILLSADTSIVMLWQVWTADSLTAHLGGFLSSVWSSARKVCLQWMELHYCTLLNRQDWEFKPSEFSVHRSNTLKLLTATVLS